MYNFENADDLKTHYGFHQVLLLDKSLGMYELDVEGTTYGPVGKIRASDGSTINGESVPALKELGKVSRERKREERNLESILS